jgi:hypothetical protein
VQKSKRDRDGRILWDHNKKEKWRIRLIKVKDPRAVMVKPTLEDILETPANRVLARINGFKTLDQTMQKDMITW